jgi:hypothetical protein
MSRPTSPAPRRSLRQRGSAPLVVPEGEATPELTKRAVSSKRSTTSLKAQADADGVLQPDTKVNGSAAPDSGKKPVGERCAGPEVTSAHVDRAHAATNSRSTSSVDRSGRWR